MKRIGLTGGLGSGKSTVAKIFEALNVPVYYADNASKKLMEEDQELVQSIKIFFGEEAYKDGELNRKFLANEVFNNKKKLALLNSIVHPATIKDAENWMQKQQSPYIIKEAALIFESGSQKNLDYVIGVKASLSLRIKRAMQRDNITEEEVLARINKQMHEEEKLRLCDYVILNDESDLVIPQVLKLHKIFSEK